MPQAHNTVPSLWQSFRLMQQAAGEHAPALRRSMVLFILASIFEGLAFACFYPLIAALLANPIEIQTAWQWLAAMAGLAMMDALFRWPALGFAHTDRLANVNYSLRLQLGEQLRRMPLHELSKYRAGELGAILSGNVEETVTTMSGASAVVIRTLIVPMVAVAATFAIDWRMALAMAVIIALAIPVYSWSRRLSGQELHDLAAAHSRTEADIVEYIQGLPVLRAMSQTGKQARALQNTLESLRLLQISAMRKSAVPILLFSSLAELGIIAVLALGVTLIINGSLDIAALAALLVIAMRLTEPLSLFTGLTVVFDKLEAGFRRIEKLLSIKPLAVIEPLDNPEKFDIRFNNVGFAYDGTGKQTTLHDLNFNIPARSMIALVGPSGSGKTTITRLIMRYGDPQSGAIEIGGKDIRHMQSDQLMRHISVVFQDVYLFNDSILENIRMGNTQAGNEEVMLAADKANCRQFISRLPDGYNTNVGDIGGSLSGGERQRISIARAILKDAPIIILDEPTAALDTESEVMVQQAIDALVKDRTVIVIAHRLSTVKGADQILVLNEGRLVERGCHDELLTTKGKYHAMWSAQQSVKQWH